MEGFVLGQAIGDQIGPGLGLEQLTGCDGLFHQLGALGVDLAAAQGIVAYLRVAHVVVRGQADGSAVGLQPGVGIVFQQHIQGWGLGQLYGVAAAAVAPAYAVHNDQYNGFFHILIASSYKVSDLGT